MENPNKDQARKEWLSNLKDGDIAVVFDISGRVAAVGEVKKDADGLWSVSGHHARFDAEGLRKPAQWGGWIAPAPPESIERCRRHAAVNAARRRLESAVRDLTDDQVLDLSAILWPEVKP